MTSFFYLSPDKKLISGGAGEKPPAEYVGFIEYRAVPPEAEIFSFEIKPQFRRRGYGRAMLTAFLSKCAADGLTSVFLEVSVLNTAALSLYLSCGFTERYGRKSYYPDGADAIVLKREADASPVK